MERPAVSTVPSTDEVFRRVVEWTIDERAARTPDELAAALRPVFPRVTVFERQLEGQEAKLYAYRDGTFETTAGDPWWQAEGVAVHRVSRESGRLTSVTPAWAKLMLTDPENLIGRHFSDFVSPIMRPVARALFRLLRERHEIETQASVQRPDGSAIAIQIHAICGEHEVEVHTRPLL
jgi:PAS domain-containing protein